ncbi:hypothetical protein BS47DRAFT_163156 [Hydnum rufescens UP504]|uniref:Uncharacterized protein n=1 Tax=Hydnum rufescens UP504 TaxID=1448309 RepID=A0A9P6B7K0_9AGAM|nr:hypothetical protein BS47DRAFT_163156 [Hydnum rufescens UP504]
MIQTSVCVPVFAANKKRKVRPRVCYSLLTNTIQKLEELTTKSSTGVSPFSGITARSR